jgi:hypothetical protein
MPLNLTSEDETNTFSYITQMQSIGFGMGATGVRRHVFHIAKKGVLGKHLSVITGLVCFSCDEEFN